MGIKQKIEFLYRHPDFFIKLIRLKRTLKQTRKEGKQCWVMQCDFKGHYPYLKSYFEYGKNIDDVEIYFVVGSSKKDTTISFLIEQGVPEDRILWPIDLVALTEWDVYMSPTGWGNVFPHNHNSIRAQIFHTLADKNLEYGKNLLNFNVIFANGPVHHDFINKYVFEPYPEGKSICKVIDTGYAKIDDLFDGSFSKTSLRKKMDIKADDTRPIILYAPNWEATSALMKYGEDVFEYFRRCDYIVIIKLHYMSLLSREDHAITFNKNNFNETDFKWIDWGAVLEKYRKFENIHIVYDESLNPLLFLADLMLTDYGGASLEFLCMKKPVVYLDSPEFFEIRGSHVFENKSRETGPIVDNMEGMALCIDNLLNGQDIYIEKRAAMMENLIFNPGNATKTGFLSLYNIIKDKQKHYSE